jgi:predicted metal-binding protein
MPFAAVGDVVVDYSVRGLCRRPYPNHPRGCPNFGKRADCPPKARRFFDVFRLGGVFAIWNVFDFAEHTSRMRALHPEWSDRQVECCLYWQGKARKDLRAEMQRFLSAHPEYRHTSYAIVTTPEAMGVNVTATMRGIGIRLEWPPVTRAYQVALAGRLRAAAEGSSDDD